MDIGVDLVPSDDGQPVPGEVRFGARRLRVVAVLDRWYGRDDTWWKLETEDGGRSILRHAHASGEWTLAAVPNEHGTVVPVRPAAPHQ